MTFKIPCSFCYSHVVWSLGNLLTEKENHKCLLMLYYFPFCAAIPQCAPNWVQFPSLSLTICFSEEVHLVIITFCIGFIFLITSTVKVEMVLGFLMWFSICGSVLMGKKVQWSWLLIINRFFWYKNNFWLECLRKQLSCYCIVATYLVLSAREERFW